MRFVQILANLEWNSKAKYLKAYIQPKGLLSHLTRVKGALGAIDTENVDRLLIVTETRKVSSILRTTDAQLYLQIFIMSSFKCNRSC